MMSASDINPTAVSWNHAHEHLADYFQMLDRVTPACTLLPRVLRRNAKCTDELPDLLSRQLQRSHGPLRNITATSDLNYVHSSSTCDGVNVICAARGGTPRCFVWSAAFDELLSRCVNR